MVDFAHTQMSKKKIAVVIRIAVLWTNASLLLLEPIWTNFNEIVPEIHTFFIQENAAENVVCKMVASWPRP